MSGYTPAFRDIYTGTLYGKWPAAAVWASLIPLFDVHGEIDMSLQAISGMTGWPMDLLQQGIEELMTPDPNSRTPGEEGRRLVLIDPHRPWGWRAVNHRKYREKARLMAKASRESESGENAKRMQDRRRPPQTAADRPSDSDSDSDSDSEVRGDISDEIPPSPSSAALKRVDERISQNPVGAEPSPEGCVPQKTAVRTGAPRGTRIPLPFVVSDSMRAWAQANAPNVDVATATLEFEDYWRSVSGKTAIKLDWEAVWRNRMRQVEERAQQRKQPYPAAAPARKARAFPA